MNIPKQSALEENITLTAKGSAIIFFGKMFAFAARFVMSVFVIRLLGAEQYGLYNLSLTAISIAASLSFLGLNTGIVRYVSVYLNRKAFGELKGILQIGIVFPVILSILVSICVFIFSEEIAIGIFNETELTKLLKIAVFAVPFIVALSVQGSALKGFNRIQDQVISESISRPLIRFIFLLLFFFGGLNPQRAIVAQNLGLIGASIVAFLFLYKSVEDHLISTNPIWRPKQLFSFSLPLYLSNLFSTLYQNIQTLVLGSLSNAFNVGIFSVAYQVNILGGFFHNSIVVASRPIIARLADNELYDELNGYFQTTTKWSFTFNLPIFLILLLFPNDILLLFGESFHQGASTLMLLAWAKLAQTSSGLSTVILEMTGNTKLVLLNAIISIVLTIGLSGLLIPLYGVLGAAITTLSINSLVTIISIIEVYMLFKMLPYDKTIYKPLLAGAISGLISWFFATKFIPEESIALKISSFLLLGLIYLGIIYLLKLSPEDQLVLSKISDRASRYVKKRNIS